MHMPVKFLSGSVKVCRSYRRKADFEQILGCHEYKDSVAQSGGV